MADGIAGLSSIFTSLLQHRADQEARQKAGIASSVVELAVKNPEIASTSGFKALVTDAFGKQGADAFINIFGEVMKNPEQVAKAVLGSDIAGPASAVPQEEFAASLPAIAQGKTSQAALTSLARQGGEPAVAGAVQQAEALKPVPLKELPAKRGAEVLKERISESSPAELGLAFGSDIGNLSLGQKKIAAAFLRQGQPKTLFKTLKEGDKLNNYVVQIYPDGRFDAQLMSSAPRSVEAPARMSQTAHNHSIMEAGAKFDVTADDIATGLERFDTKTRTKILRQARKLTEGKGQQYKDRALKELNARKVGQPPGTGDTLMAVLSPNDLRKIVRGSVEFISALMDEEFGQAPGAAPAPVAETPPAEGGAPPLFIPPGFPGAGGPGTTPKILSIKKKGE